MYAVYTISAPEKIQVTMEMSMSLGEWTRLAKQLPEAWPSTDLARAITDLALRMSTKVHYTPDDGESE